MTGESVPSGRSTGREGRWGRRIGIAVVVALALAVAVHALDVLARRGEQPVPTPFALALALLSLAAGFALLALGVLLATRRGLRWWRLLAVAAIAVGLFWTVLPVGLAWYTTHHPASGDPGPSGAGDPGYQDVRILSTDGVSLAAWYKPAENGVTIVCLPGSNGATRRTVLPHARVVVEHGYGVLLLDPRGHGGSGGRSMEYGWYGSTDVGAAVDWLSTERGVEPGSIGILGESMGGEQAITAAAADNRIGAVVSEGGSERVYEDVRRTLRGLAVVLGVPQYRALFGLTDLLADASVPIPLEDAVVATAPRPILLINTAAEKHYGERYAAASPQSTELWAPASEQHTGALLEHPQEWEERVVGFFDGALSGTREGTKTAE